MSPHHRVLQAVVLASVLSVGGAWAGEEGDRGIPTSAPPFLVSGTIISPPARIALIVILDEQGKATSERRLHEGDTVEGYRVATIRQDQVFFEREGRVFLIRVGNRQPIPTVDVAIPSARKREISAEFVPPPDNIEEIRKQADSFIERLRENPAFQKGRQELDRRFRERSGTPND